MNTLTFLVVLLPLVFMLHDFEEIIIFKPWYTRNQEYLKNHFPKLSKKAGAHFESLSVPAFTAAVAEEFLILSSLSFVSLLKEDYAYWFAGFMGFFLHLFIHIGQWIMIKKYIPGILTAILSLLYCGYSFMFILNNNLFSPSQIIFLSATGLLIMMANLLLIHKLGNKLDIWLLNYQQKD